MRRLFAIALTLVMLLAALTGCMASQNPSGKEGGGNNDDGNVAKHGQFSYEEDQESYSAGVPGVKTEGFNNVTESPINTHLDAVERAKNECTIQWKDIQVDYDADAGVWKVLFYTQGTLGGCQTVYLGLNGKTLMIVYGE